MSTVTGRVVSLETYTNTRIRLTIDYLVEYTPRDKTLGKPLVRPSFSSEIPFPMHFETFVTTWNFLNALS